MGQTNYDLEPCRSFAGMVVGGNTNVKSASAEVEIHFGTGIVAGTNPETQVTIPSTSSDVFRGIAVHTHKAGGVDYTATYKPKDVVGYLTKGVVAVDSSVAVNVDDKAYIVATGVNAGKFTNVSTGNIDTKGVFVQSIASAGLVDVEINLP